MQKRQDCGCYGGTRFSQHKLDEKSEHCVKHKLVAASKTITVANQEAASAGEDSGALATSSVWLVVVCQGCRKNWLGAARRWFLLAAPPVTDADEPKRGWLSFCAGSSGRSSLSVRLERQHIGFVFSHFRAAPIRSKRPVR